MRGPSAREPNGTTGCFAGGHHSPNASSEPFKELPVPPPRRLVGCLAACVLDLRIVYTPWGQARSGHASEFERGQSGIVGQKNIRTRV